MLEIVEDKVGVFGEIGGLVEMTLPSSSSAVELVDGGIKTSVNSKKIEGIGFKRLVGATSAKGANVNVAYGSMTNAFVVDAADGKSDVDVGD